MAISKKAIDNANRLRYVRALERFHKSMVAYLMKAEFVTQEGYDKKIENNLKLLTRVEEVPLYKGALQDLQNLVKKMRSYQNSQEDMEHIKAEILYASNQLEKSKNAKRYKKDKHTHRKYDEWN